MEIVAADGDQGSLKPVEDKGRCSTGGNRSSARHEIRDHDEMSPGGRSRPGRRHYGFRYRSKNSTIFL